MGVGDIPQMSGSMANYTIGNTPSADANKLQWHKIVDGDKTLLICDRVILVSVSWNDLNGQGYITGKTITIDGAQYKCRSLTGGTGPRSSNDWYSGGTPTNNEWDRFVTREEVISGLPAPVSSDLDSTINSTDKGSTHNQFWNWFGRLLLVSRDIFWKFVDPCGSRVRFGPLLVRQLCLESDRGCRFPPRP